MKMTFAKRIAKAEKEGREAAQQGKGRPTNPYTAKYLSHVWDMEWCRIYRNMQDERRAPKNP